MGEEIGPVCPVSAVAVSDDMRNDREIVQVRRAARNIDNGFARWELLARLTAPVRLTPAAATPPREQEPIAEIMAALRRRFADVIHNRLTSNHAINTVIF